ncbi:Rieske (2Fe-2S) protein [Nevskia sp.]|uniref:QcrA and Rieske domain-containing protein n=1 Tax=Nevskia sp. TaxID=1929292 RepID=UPI0025E887A8|nr:Rieske (2Fe-2S) protein [Nevskia sp.]
MSKPSPHDACACCATDLPTDSGRRQMLTGALSLAALAATSLPAMAQDATAARSLKPQPGDKLAFMLGPKAGQEILPADIQFGEPPTLAYPLDPTTGKALVAKASMLTVIRLKPDDLKPASAANSADGIVAYSSLCTHYGCPITTLHPSQTQIVCNCHGSVFNAADRGVVSNGPAQRRLAMLPLAIKDGAVVVTGKFDGPLGPPT